MKKFVFTAFLFFLFAGGSYSQNGWQFQNPNPTGNGLYCISFVNSLTGFAVGQNGTLIKTLDGGTSWTLINTGHNGIYDYFSAVVFTSVNTGYIAAGGGGLGSGKILKTTNAGMNWIMVNPGAIYPVFGIYFVNENTGYGTGSFGKIYKTTDAGNNWSVQTISSSNFGNIFFTGVNTGYVSGNDSSIYKTTNSGTNWFKIQHAGRSYNGALYFINDNTGFCCTSLDGLKKTTNGGTSWFNSDNTRLWNTIFFINQSTGYISCSTGEFKKTINAGQSWTQISSISNGAFNYFIFTDSLNAIGAGDEGLIKKSTNGGINWANINNNVRDSLFSIVFAGDIGYTAGGSGTVMKSTNSGQTWVAQSKITAATITDLCLLNSNEVVGVGTGRKIIRTTNGGVNWLSATPGNYSSHLYSVTQVGSGSLVSVGDNGLIMKSTNSGANWINVTGPVTLSLKSVSFTDSLNGTAVGIGGTIIRTTNSGNNWFQISTTDFTFNDLNGISFLNSNTGIAVGNSGTILKTTNGGVNWIQKSSGTIEDIISVSISGSVCFATLFSSYVIKSTNLGENWTSHFTNSNSALLSVFFNDANTGWICGTGGAILKTTDGGGVFVGKISTEVPSDFGLEQNYPNPFNSVTSVKFKVALCHSCGGRNPFVKLKVFDLLGREVKTLVNEVLQPGTYSVRFNANNLSSGIYFYSLEAKNIRITKKCILLK